MNAEITTLLDFIASSFPKSSDMGNDAKVGINLLELEELSMNFREEG